MVVYAVIGLVWLLTFAYIGMIRDEKRELAAELYRATRELEFLRSHIELGPRPVAARAKLTLMSTAAEELVN